MDWEQVWSWDGVHLRPSAQLWVAMIIEEWMHTRNKDSNTRNGEEGGKSQEQQRTNTRNKLSCGFLNTRGWNEIKWRIIVEECKELDIVAIAETGWHGKIAWQEGGWKGIGRGRNVGEKRGGRVGILVKEKVGRQVEEIHMKDGGDNLT